VADEYNFTPRNSPRGRLFNSAGMKFAFCNFHSAIFISNEPGPESDGCLVALAVFKTVVGPLAGRGMFDSYPLRHFRLTALKI